MKEVHEWTLEQKAVLEHAKSFPNKRSEMRANPPSSIMVEALAGSGKTTVMCEFARSLPSYCIVEALAFNKLIAKELAAQMPEGVNCRTFSSLGYGVWRNYTGLKKLDLKKWKIQDIYKTLGLGGIRETFPDLARIISLAKAAGMNPCLADDAPQQYMTESAAEEWIYLAEQQDLTFGKKGGSITQERAIEACRQVLAESCVQAIQGQIDFDDMLYMPALWGGKFPSPDVVIVDEFQDVSSIQNALISKMLGKYGILVAVGDRHQSIYAFRGAGHGAIPDGIRQFKCKQLPLSVTFRCGKMIAEEAAQIVPTLKTLHDQHMGEVLPEGKWNHETVKVGDAILCRNNAPLVDICLSLIAKRVPAKILGNDIGKGLKKILSDLDTDNLLVIPDRLHNYESKKVAEFTKKGQFGMAQRLEDRCQALRLIIYTFDAGNDSLKDVEELIDSMFSDETPLVTLCSIHKSKGREWDRVFFLDSHLIPSKYAQTSEALQQEDNLRYVGITRAKNCLHYVSSASFGGVDVEEGKGE